MNFKNCYSLCACIQIWERLVEIGKVYPVGGNKDGSYLTVYSLGAFEINLINVSVQGNRNRKPTTRLAS